MNRIAEIGAWGLLACASALSPPAPAQDFAIYGQATNVTQWHYDQYGRATNKVDAANSVIFVYKYDPDNRLTNRWTPAMGNSSVFT